MKCDQVRDNLVAQQGGELTAEEISAVEAHLTSCAACQTEANDLQSTLSLFHALPEIKPSAKVWENLSTEVDRDARVVVAKRPTTTANFTRLLRLAAAASLLTAAISFGFVAYVTRSVPIATISQILPGTDLAPGKTFRAGETFTAPTFVVLTIPEVGTLKLEKDSTIRFDSRRRIALQAGNVFAEIMPNGKGFEILSGDTTVTVHGTRFGVVAAAKPTIYVLEGSVSVDSSAGKLQLGSRQQATVGGPVTGLYDEALRWLSQYESPTIALRVDSYEKTMSRGSPAAFRLSFRSASPAPVLLETLRDLPGHIVVKVTDPAGKEYLATLDGCVSPIHARPGPNGSLRIDVTSDIVLDCRLLLKDGFEQPGRYTLTLSYNGTRTPESSGSVIPSDPISIEVRN
jgi:hypothetical protein